RASAGGFPAGRPPSRRPLPESLRRGPGTSDPRGRVSPRPPPGKPTRTGAGPGPHPPAVACARKRRRALLPRGGGCRVTSRGGRGRRYVGQVDADGGAVGRGVGADVVQPFEEELLGGRRRKTREELARLQLFHARPRLSCGRPFPGSLHPSLLEMSVGAFQMP